MEKYYLTLFKVIICCSLSLTSGQNYEDPEPFLPNHGLDWSYNYNYKYSYGDLGLTCEQRDRCEDRANLVQRLFLEPENVEKFNCFCDGQCQIYGDCCHDFEPTRENQIFEEFELQRNLFTCAMVDGLGVDRPVYIVDTCPKGYADRIVKDACERKPQGDMLSNVPVSAAISGILYKNYFCAMCNNDYTYSFLDIDIACGNLPTGMDTGSNDFHIEDAILRLLSSKDNNCTVMFKHKLHKPRFCKENTISNCPSDWKNRSVKRKCRSSESTAYRYALSRIFRNQFCAECHQVNRSLLDCEDTVTRTPEPTKPPLGTGYLPPFSILLDVNKASGHVKERVGFVNNEFIEKVVLMRSCQENQVYDPFSRLCRIVYCAEGQVFQNGFCVGDENDNNEPMTDKPYIDPSISFSSTSNPRPNSPHVTKSNISPSSKGTKSTLRWEIATPKTETVKRATLPGGVYIGVIDVDCPFLILNSSEFQNVGHDGMVYIPAYNKYFNSGEYQNASAGHIFICTPFTERNYTDDANVTRHFEMFKFDRLQGLLSYIGLLISIICLFVVFVIYMVFPELRNTAGKCIVCLVISLLFAQVTFMLGGPLREYKIACFTLAVLVHFFYLCAFCWINVLSIDILTIIFARTTRTDEDSYRFAFYSLYAWITPTVIVGGALILEFFGAQIPNFQPKYGDGLCWITQQWPLVITFAGPVALIVLINIILYTVTSVKLCMLARAARYLQAEGKQKRNFLLYIKLCFIMGTTWVFGFVAAVTELNYLWYLFILFNTLQGAFICFAFVCTRTVFRLLSGKHNKKPKVTPRPGPTSTKINSSNSNGNPGHVVNSWNSTNNTVLDTSYNGDSKILETRETCI